LKKCQILKLSAGENYGMEEIECLIRLGDGGQGFGLGLG
jgi:hypothetical protein